VGVAVQFHAFLTSAVAESGQLHALAALSPGKKTPSTHWLGGWVIPRAGTDVVVTRKFSAPAENRTWDALNLSLLQGTGYTSFYSVLPQDRIPLDSLLFTNHDSSPFIRCYVTSAGETTSLNIGRMYFGYDYRS